MKLTLERAKQLISEEVSEQHLIIHSLNVCYAMGAMAKFLGEDEEYFMAVGYLHDYDYEKYPEEHLQHTEKPLKNAGVDDEAIRAILSHGWGLCTDVEPLTTMEKCLYTVDELTGIIQAYARMRPDGLNGIEISSFMKKFKDKKFAAKCNREVIKKGCELLGLEVARVAEVCISGMAEHAKELGF